MKLYTHIPNSLGRPEILDVGGDAGDCLTNLRMATASAWSQDRRARRICCSSHGMNLECLGHQLFTHRSSLFSLCSPRMEKLFREYSTYSLVITDLHTSNNLHGEFVLITFNLHYSSWPAAIQATLPSTSPHCMLSGKYVTNELALHKAQNILV